MFKVIGIRNEYFSKLKQNNKVTVKYLHEGPCRGYFLTLIESYRLELNRSAIPLSDFQPQFLDRKCV